MKLSKGTETEMVNMNDIVADNSDVEKEHEEQIEKITESDSKITTKQDESNPLDIGVENESRNETQDEDDKTREYVIDSIVDHKVNKIRRHCYVKYGWNLYRVR